MADSRIDIRFVVHAEELKAGLKTVTNEYQSVVAKAGKSIEGVTAKQINETRKQVAATQKGAAQMVDAHVWAFGKVQLAHAKHYAKLVENSARTDAKEASLLAKKESREATSIGKRMSADAKLFAKRVSLAEQAEAKEAALLARQTARESEANAKRTLAHAKAFASRVSNSEKQDAKIPAASAAQMATIYKRVDETRIKGTDAVRAKIFQIEELIRKERVRVLTATDKADELNHKNRIKRLNAELQLHRSSEKKTTGGRTFTEQLEKNVFSRFNVGGANVGDALGGLGGGKALMAGGAVAGAAAVGLALKESVEVFSKYQDALADLSALTGVSGKDLDSLGDKARSLGTKFGVDAPQAIESFKLVLSALGPAIAKDQAALESMGNSVMTLAKASGADAQTATSALTVTMNQFGLGLGTPQEQAVQMTRIMNVMAAGAKEGAAEVPQLAEAMKQVGATAKEQGVSVEGAAAAIEVLSQRGINGAEAGTAYRNVLSFMASGTEEAEKALKSMGLTFADINPQIVGQEKGLATLNNAFDKVKDPVQKSSLLLDIFKRENQNAALVLMESTDALGKTTEAISGTNTATDQANVKMDTLSQQWERFKTGISNVMTSIGKAVAPVLEKLLNDINLFIAGVEKSIKFVGDLFKSSETLIAEADAAIKAESDRRIAEGMARTARMREFFAGTAKRLEIINNLGKPKPKTEEELAKERAAHAKSVAQAKKATDEKYNHEKQQIEETLQYQQEWEEIYFAWGKKTKEEAELAKLELEKDANDQKLQLAIKFRDVQTQAEIRLFSDLIEEKLRLLRKAVADAKEILPPLPDAIPLGLPNEDGTVNFSGIKTPDESKAKLVETPDYVKDLANNAKSAFESLLFDPLDAMISKTTNGVDKFFMNITSQLLKLASSKLLEGIFGGLLAILNPASGLGFLGGFLKVFGIKFADGGIVPGVDTGKDTVPAVLRPGEFVLTRNAARAIGYDNLDGINSLARNPSLGLSGGLPHGGQDKQSIKIGGIIRRGDRPIGKRQDETDLGTDGSLRIGSLANAINRSNYNANFAVNNNGQLISEIRALRQVVAQQQTIVMDMYGVHLGTLRSRNANNIGVIA